MSIVQDAGLLTEEGNASVCKRKKAGKESLLGLYGIVGGSLLFLLVTLLL